MSNIKASRWMAINEYFTKTAGPDAFQKILNAMNPADRQIFGQTITTLSWIDYPAYMRWVFTADKVLGRGDNQLVEKSAIYSAQANFQGLYKFFIKLLDPGYVIKRAGAIWMQYVDSGKMEIKQSNDKRVQLQLTDIKDIPRGHDLTLNPFYEEILRISGAKNPIANHPKCIARGDGHCLWDISWE